jgi:hypothetical protein
MRRFLRPRTAFTVLGLLAGLLGTAAPAHAALTVNIDNVSQAEGNAGTTTFTFHITGTTDAGAYAGGGQVSATTADGTALSTATQATQPGADYVAKTQTFTIPAIGASLSNQPIGSFDVTVNGDTTFELNDQFSVTLATVLNTPAFTIGTGTGTGTIQNDDTRPHLIFNDPSPKTEGNAGTSAYNFPVTLSNATYLDVQFNATTIGGSATSAPGGPGNPDYQEILDQTFTFLAGTTTFNVPVTVNGDTTFEGNETLGVRFTNFTNQFVAIDAVPGGVQQTNGVINNDDVAPTFTISALTQVLCETDNPIQITVTLSQASGLPATVTLTDNTGSAQDPADFALTPKVLNFAPGETVKTATLTPIHDNLVEGPETIIVVATGTSGTTGGPVQLATITLNDPDSLSLNLVQISGDSVISINGISQQCFRVTVTDGCGDPFANQTVQVSINGNTGNNSSFPLLLDNAGVGEFCFTPVFPGSDSVQVSAFNGIQTFFSNIINLDFTVGSNTGNASVTGAGATDAAEAAGPVGIFSFFSLDVKNLRNGRTQGSVNGTLPLAGAATLRSLKMTNLIAGQGLPDGKKALAFGTAKLIVQIGGPGSGIRTVQAPVFIRVDALDNGLPGVPNDRFEITFLVDTRKEAGRKAVVLGGLPSDTFTVGGNVEHGNNGARGDIRITTGLGGSF